MFQVTCQTLSLPTDCHVLYTQVLSPAARHKKKRLLSVCRCYTSKLPAGCSSLLFFSLSLFSFLFFIMPSAFYININTYLSSSTTHLCPGRFAYNLTYRYVDRRTAGPALHYSPFRFSHFIFCLFGSNDQTHSTRLKRPDI